MNPNEKEAGIIEASAFRLVDSQGRVRAELTVGPSDEPRLDFMDEAGELRASLAMADDGDCWLDLLGRENDRGEHEHVTFILPTDPDEAPVQRERVA